MLATLPLIAAAGFDVHVAAPPGGPLAALLDQCGVPRVPWQTIDTQNKRLSLSQLRDDAANLFRRLRPDLAHANSLSMSRIAGPVAAELEIASIGHLRDIVGLTRQVVEDLNAHRRLVAVSQATREFHVAQGVDPAKCVVVHNGVDLVEFRPRTATGYLHEELKLPADSRLIATIGQLGLRKGTDVALVAAGRVASHVPGVHWLVVGERTSNKHESRVFEAHLHAFASSPSLAGRVHFLGSRNDVPRLLAECALLVHAARQEPLGRVLLEAAANGLAVVATDVGGTREIFPSELNCARIVPVNDSLVLADAVIALLRNEVHRQLLGSAARRRVEQAFDIRDAASRLVHLYQEIAHVIAAP
jgi:glycosyltransferase involved in cell wall biosynthesis